MRNARSTANGVERTEAQDTIAAAEARRAEYIDLDLTVPTRIKGDFVDIGPLLLEADEYCRTGGLLTLAPTKEMRMFWTWFLGEFILQADGQPPRSWLAFSAGR